METLPFDPADYLDSEEGIAAYLEDARAFGTAAVSDAMSVIARARARMKAKVRIGSASAANAVRDVKGR